MREPDPITAPTLPGELSKAGYQTYLIGRTMHQYPPSARYGYDHVQLASGYEPDPFHRQIRAETDQVDGFASHGLNFNGWTARPWHLDEVWHPTNYIVNEGLKFLENRDQTCPFFLTVSFYAPHPHYMFRKCEPYEGSARIPFIISGGDSLGLQSGQLFDGPVCLEDLMPTLLDLAGVGVPNGLDGHSLVSILRGEQTYWRPFLHGEHAPCYSQEQANHYLVDQTTKYIWRPLSGDEQLFDLAKDPNECNNLALRPDHLNRLCLWRGRLIERLADRPEGFTDGERLIVGRDYPGIFPHIQQDR